MIRQILVLLVLCSLLCFDRSSAQSIVTPGIASGSLSGAIVSSQLPKQSVVRKSRVATPSVQQASAVLSYYDPTTPKSEWYGGYSYTPFVMAFLGERMTLPWSTGFVDSVSFWADGGTADTVTVWLMPVAMSTDGFLVIDPNGSPYARTALYRPAETRSVPTLWKIPFDHIQVPKEFAVMVNPKVDDTLKVFKSIFIRGDSGAIRARTLENTRSVFIGLQGNQLFSYVLDSVFRLTGETDLRFTNLYFTAYVTQGDASVAQGSADQHIGIYPNPALTSVQLEVGTDINPADLVRIYNQLGVMVYSGPVGNGSLNVNAFTNGVYHLKIQSARRMISESFVVAH